MTVAPLRLHIHVEELELRDPRGRTAADVALAVLPGLAIGGQPARRLTSPFWWRLATATAF